MIFEMGVLLIVGAYVLILQSINPKTLRRFTILFFSVMLFQYFVQAMWINANLERWAYLYLDVSWILTIGWAVIILVSMYIAEAYYPKSKLGAKYLLAVLMASFIGVFAEMAVVELGIRQYPEATQALFSGIYILSVLPIEALYYIPIFISFMVATAGYWETSLNHKEQMMGGKK